MNGLAVLLADQSTGWCRRMRWNYNNILTILLENLQQYDEYDQVEEVNNSFLRLQEK